MSSCIKSLHTLLQAVLRVTSTLQSPKELMGLQGSSTAIGIHLKSLLFWDVVYQKDEEERKEKRRKEEKEAVFVVKLQKRWHSKAQLKKWPCLGKNSFFCLFFWVCIQPPPIPSPLPSFLGSCFPFLHRNHCIHLFSQGCSLMPGTLHFVLKKGL